jgi:hypothetical protein
LDDITITVTVLNEKRLPDSHSPKTDASQFVIEI